MMIILLLYVALLCLNSIPYMFYVLGVKIYNIVSVSLVLV